MRGWLFLLPVLGLLHGGLASAADYARPAVIKLTELAGMESLNTKRRTLIGNTLMTASNNGWLKYLYGSADPKRGGFDCSGAMY